MRDDHRRRPGLAGAVAGGMLVGTGLAICFFAMGWLASAVNGAGPWGAVVGGIGMAVVGVWSAMGGVAPPSDPDSEHGGQS